LSQLVQESFAWPGTGCHGDNLVCTVYRSYSSLALHQNHTTMPACMVKVSSKIQGSQCFAGCCSINHISLSAGLGVQSHPLCRTCFGHYVALSYV